MRLNYKQTEAIDILEDKETRILVFGGGAGSSKSFLGCYWILKNCLKYPETRWLIGRARLSTLKQTTLLTFLEVCKLQGVIIGKHFNINQQSNTIIFNNGSVIFLKDLFYYPSDPEFDGLGGLEITGALIEEAQQITRKALTIVSTRIRYKLDDFGLTPKILLTCNPSKNFIYSEFYKPSKEGKLPKDKKFIQALASDNPNISKHYIENLLKAPKAQRDRLLYGIWEVDDDSALISYDNIINIFTNTHVSKESDTKYITCDVARMGSDKAVIMVWQGLEVKEIYEYDVSKITELQTIIVNLKNKHGISNSNIIADEDGVGGGLVDNLKIKGFINNSKALNDENYQNLKTQCYYKLSEIIERNEIYISAELSTKQEEAIIEELEQVKATDSDSDGKLKIINKQQIKQNIGRSPDYSDAMMMRMFYQLVPNPPKNLGIITSKNRKQKIW